MNIEIISWRDDETDGKLFIDGVEVSSNVAWTMIDPGAGYTIADWRDNKRWAVETASKAAGKAIADWYDQAERSVHVTKPHYAVSCWYCDARVEWDAELSNFVVEGAKATVCKGEGSPDQLHMGDGH